MSTQQEIEKKLLYAAKEKGRWFYIKKFLKREWAGSSIGMGQVIEWAHEYDEKSGIAVDFATPECRDEDLTDFIQRKMTPELFEDSDSDSDSEDGIPVELITKDGVEYLVEEATGIVYDLKEWTENEKMVKVGQQLSFFNGEGSLHFP